MAVRSKSDTLVARIVGEGMHAAADAGEGDVARDLLPSVQGLRLAPYEPDLVRGDKMAFGLQRRVVGVDSRLEPDLRPGHWSSRCLSSCRSWFDLSW